MPTYTITAPNGNTYEIDGPAGATHEQAVRALLAQHPEAATPATPKSGFMPALKSGYENLKGDVAAVAGRAGLMGLPEAEAYREARKAKSEALYKPTEEGWLDAPFTKMGELMGGSLPYMAAPVVAGTAAAAAAPAVGLGALGTTIAGAGAAGLTSMGQFTGSNLSRQVDEGKKLGETDLTAAAAAAIPQAALDMVSLRMTPAVRGLIFKGTGLKLSEKAAADVASQNIKQIAADYLKATGKTMTAEGLTEAGQQVFERMQAGLNLTDENARKEYFDNFLGGALLGGALAGPGHFVERGNLQTEQAKAKAAEQQKQADAAAAQRQQELDTKRADPDYLKNMLAAQDQYTQQLNELTKASKEGAKDDPLAASKRAQAAAARRALLDSDEYLQHKEEFADIQPQADAYRIKQAELTKAQEELAAAQKAADLADPTKQEALHAQREQLLGQKSAAALEAQQAARTGNMDAAAAAEAKIADIDKQIEALVPLLGSRPAPAQVLQESQIQEQLLRLAGGKNAKGKDVAGAYTQALMAGKTEEAAAIRQQIADLQKQLAPINRTRDEANTRATALADQERVENEPGQSISHAPLPAVNTNALLRGVFGQKADMIPGAPQSAGDKARVAKPAPAPGTTEYQQESMFPDMEPGGNAGTALENLRAQIESLRMRPNMPAATLAQLDRYSKTLESPAFSNTDNQMAQNALADITDNVNQIAYQGAGQGVERNASMGEVRTKIDAINKRLETLNGSIEQAKADVRNKVRSEGDTRSDVEVQYDRSQELRGLLRTQKELGAERQRLLSAQTVNMTPYERQQKKLVAIGAPEATDATPEQIERAQRGDKRGYEVGAVPVEPATQQDTLFQQTPGEDGEVTTTVQQGEERVADRTPSLDRGMAKITRPNERIAGLDRAGPDDRAVTEAEAQLSEKDTQTLDMLDPIFGADSAARRAVDEAEEGLRRTQNAVRETESRLEAAKAFLQYHQQKLQEAITASPTAQRRMLLEGEELGAKRKLEQALSKVRTAEHLKAIGGASSDEQVRKTQEAVARATEAAQKAEADTNAALKAFRDEWKAAEKSGWLTPQLLEFVQGRDIKTDLAKAQTDLAGMFDRSAPGANQVPGTSAAIRAMRVFDTAPQLNLYALQQAFVKSMPEIRRSAGPRVAELVDTIFKLRIAEKVIGKAQNLADAYATKQIGLNRVNRTLAEKVKDAKAAIAASDKQLSQANVKLEIAQAEATALEKQLADMRAEIESLTQEADADESVEKARAEVGRREKDVAQTSARLEQLKASKDTRITEARENLRRAKDTQQMLFENEQALRNGEPMPLQKSIDDMNASIRAVFDKMEATLEDEAIIPTVDLEDTAADLNTVERHMSDLNRVENSLVDLLKQHVSDFMEVQEQVETLLDSSTLLESDVFDPERENAQRIVNKAGVAAQLQALHAEEARTMTQRDSALGSIDRVLETNAAIVSEKNPTPEHLARLEQQRKRLTAEREEKAQMFTERLSALRDKMAALDEEAATAPDPKLKDWGRTQIETLRGARDRLQAQINRINDRIGAVRKNRDSVMKTQRALGTSRMQELEKLGLGKQEATTDAKRKALTDELVASLTHQRVEERKADTKVQSAYRRFRAIRARLFEAPLSERATLRARSVEAHRAWREAALDRARLQDHLVKLERMQLGIAQELAKLPTTVAEKSLSESEQRAKEQEDLKRAKRLYDNAYENYDRVRDNPKSTPAKIEQARQDWVAARMRLVAADKRKLGYVNAEGRTVETTPAAEQTAETMTATGWGSMAQTLEDGTVRGPDFEEVAPEMQAFAERIYGPDIKWQGLAKELGALRAEFEGEVEAFLHGKAGRTLTANNARMLRSSISNPLVRQTLQMQFKGAKRDNALDLYDKIRMLEDRITELKEGRGPSKAKLKQLEEEARVAKENKKPVGRPTQVMRKTVFGANLFTGDSTKVPGRKLGKGKMSPESTVSQESTTGPDGAAKEKRIIPSPTGPQAVAQAEADLAQGSLRRNMERAKLERDLEAAQKARSEAKATYDAVMAAPNVSQAAKDRVHNALVEANEKVKTADAALGVEMKGAEKADRTVYSPVRTVGTTSLRTAAVERVANSVVSEWTNVPEISVVQSVDALPQHIRDQARADGREDLPGVLDTNTGKVYLVADNLYKESDVALTIAHEVAGHYGLRSMLGSGYAKMMNDIYNSVAAVRAEADAKMKESPNLSREVAVEEVLAEKAETQAARTGADAAMHRVFFAVKAALRRLLAKIGVAPKALQISDAEVAQVVANARRHVKRGTPGGPGGGFKAAAESTSKAVYSPKRDTATATGKLADMITAKEAGFLQRIGKNPALSIEMWGVDMRAPLIKALSAAGGKALTQASYYVRKADALMNHVYASLSYGPLQLARTSKGNFEIKAGNGPSMPALLAAVKSIKGVSSEDKMSKLQAFIAAKRASRVGWDKLNFTNAADLEKQARAMNAELAGDPAQRKALEDAAKIYNDINKGLVDFLVSSGYLSKAAGADLMRHGDYVPFYRVQPNGLSELVLGENTVVRIGDIRNNRFLAQLVGDNQKLLPLGEAMVRNTMLLTDLAMKNLAAKESAYTLQQLGAGRGRNGRNSMPIHSGKAPVGADIIKFRQEPDPHDAEDTGERWLQIKTENTAIEDIPSEMIAESLSGSFSTLPSALKAASWFSDLLRSGVTRNPMYIARQLIRDPLSATFTGGLESGPVTAVFKSLSNYTAQMAGRSAEGDTLLGKGLIHSNIFTGDVDDINKMMLQLTKGDQGAFNKFIAGWDKAAMTADAATRIQMYKDALARGMDPMEAEFAAMEMTNFNKRGMSPSVQYAARLIPFFNAQIQALNVLAKAMRGNMPQNEQLEIKAKFYRRAMTMAVFTMAYAMAMEDDDTYRNAKARDRYNNWLIPNPFGGEYIKIPIPFEVGVLFKALPEALVDEMRGDFNKEEMKAIRGALFAQIPGATSYGMPQVIKPVIEASTNTDFLSGNQIESASDQKKDVVERFGANTTEIAKDISKGLHAVGFDLSPKKLDHLVNGYLGSLPVMVARLTNSLFADETAATRPAERASDSPVYGALFQREHGGAAVDAAYAASEALDQAKRTLDSMKADGRKEDAESYAKETLERLGNEKAAAIFHQKMSQINKIERQLRNTVKDPEVLRDKLDALKVQRDKVARYYLNALPEDAR